MSNNKNKALGYGLGVITRWVFTAILMFYIFKEQPGVATRLFIIFTIIGFEALSLKANMKYWSNL